MVPVVPSGLAGELAVVRLVEHNRRSSVLAVDRTAHGIVMMADRLVMHSCSAAAVEEVQTVVRILLDAGLLAAARKLLVVVQIPKHMGYSSSSCCSLVVVPPAADEFVVSDPAYLRRATPWWIPV